MYVSLSRFPSFLSFPFQSRSSFVLHICEIITVMRQRLIGSFVSHVHFLCGSFFVFHFIFYLSFSLVHHVPSFLL